MISDQYWSINDWLIDEWSIDQWLNSWVNKIVKIKPIIERILTKLTISKLARFLILAKLVIHSIDNLAAGP